MDTDGSEDIAAATPETSSVHGTTIYKILTSDEWLTFQTNGIFTGNLLDKQDGYIHMSYHEQVQKTYQKYFQNEDVVVVHVNASLLNMDELRPEQNKPGGDTYPHIYGTIPLSAVVKTSGIFF
jgi:uncharacterized protein (DUF952 family)